MVHGSLPDSPAKTIKYTINRVFSPFLFLVSLIIETNRGDLKNSLLFPRQAIWDTLPEKEPRVRQGAPRTENQIGDRSSFMLFHFFKTDSADCEAILQGETEAFSLFLSLSL